MWFTTGTFTAGQRRFTVMSAAHRVVAVSLGSVRLGRNILYGRQNNVLRLIEPHSLYRANEIYAVQTTTSAVLDQRPRANHRRSPTGRYALRTIRRFEIGIKYTILLSPGKQYPLVFATGPGYCLRRKIWLDSRFAR